MTITGYICLIVAVAWIIYKIYVAYTSFGGTIMVSVYDAAIYPPVLGIFGLYWVLKSFRINLALWILVALWLGVAVSVAIVIRVAEEVGDRRRY